MLGEEPGRVGAELQDSEGDGVAVLDVRADTSTPISSRCGNEPTLLAREMPNATHVALLGFDAQAVQHLLSENPGVISARVTVDLARVSGAVDVSIHRVLEPWSEIGNASCGPRPAGPANPIPRIEQAPLDTQSVDPTARQVSFDVSAAFADPQAVLGHGFAIRINPSAARRSVVEMYARESGRPARLHLELGEPERELVVEIPEPGRVVFDAADGHGHLPLPAEGMTFDSEEALIEFVVERFGAIRQFDDEGNLIGAAGQALEIERPVYFDEESGEIVEVDDVIVAILGGQEGIVRVAGQAYCLKPEGCGDALFPTATGLLSARAPSSSTACSGGSCIRGNAFIRNFLIGRSIGQSITQTSGGFRRVWSWCRFYPCRRSRGANRLDVGARYFARDFAGGPVDVWSGAGRRSNVTSLTVREYSFGIAAKITPGGLQPGKPECATADCELVGVCGGGSSLTSEGDVAVRNSTGLVGNLCPPLGQEPIIVI